MDIGNGGAREGGMEGVQGERRTQAAMCGDMCAGSSVVEASSAKTGEKGEATAGCDAQALDEGGDRDRRRIIDHFDAYDNIADMPIGTSPPSPKIPVVLWSCGPVISTPGRTPTHSISSTPSSELPGLRLGMHTVPVTNRLTAVRTRVRTRTRPALDRTNVRDGYGTATLPSVPSICEIDGPSTGWRPCGSDQMEFGRALDGPVIGRLV
ncbi:hypothetical protein FB45DRAFT_868495 [Roridomyces roridus]|uniref:Uncharacterized protein n=1 Tax=Roridomyces roridus TaxID=1738132 RepID=A0AAD7BQ33_9AGAR|nr:hypothetical protein FB45DRAFT_868495 [Roridomyces roridus]